MTDSKTTSRTAPMIRLDNLHKTFGSKTVLNGMNLDIPQGSSLVIIGHIEMHFRSARA